MVAFLKLLCHVFVSPGSLGLAVAAGRGPVFVYLIAIITAAITWMAAWLTIA